MTREQRQAVDWEKILKKNHVCFAVLGNSHGHFPAIPLRRRFPCSHMNKHTDVGHKQLHQLRLSSPPATTDTCASHQHDTVVKRAGQPEEVFQGNTGGTTKVFTTKVLVKSHLENCMQETSSTLRNIRERHKCKDWKVICFLNHSILLFCYQG